ncbi:MAG: dTDP-4-dehydrorhamnose reductase [Nitrospinae bacterium]|nr:dTDP-4-dehydrorhamnose reductase [Nitrospinota bacterium]
MRVLVTGSAGQIGWRIARHLKDRHHVIAAVRTGNIEGVESVEMDITQPFSIRLAVDRTMPDAVVHCAAMTSADECEKERDACWHVNVEGTRALAEECKTDGARMVYVSTDLVFDGEKGNYAEEDAPNPLSHYAKSKLAGERVVAEILPDAVIARTAIVYGKGGVPPRGFAVWLVDALRAGKKVPLFTDQFRSHFYLEDCARAVGLLTEGKQNGLFHLSPGWRQSRHEFGLAVARAMGLDERLIEAVSMKDVPSDAPRPKDCSLANGKLVRATGFTPTPFADTLKMLKREFF